MIHITSEIGTLKKVLLHRPGAELLNLTPATLHELLFDDIPYLEVARKEHDAFSKILHDEGVEVVYLEDLVAEILKDDTIKDRFIRQFIKEADIHTKRYTDMLIDYLKDIDDTKKLVFKMMAGVSAKELDNSASSLYGLINDDSKMIIAPLPNLYFTRDPFFTLFDGVAIDHMYSKTRARETIFAEYIFKYHKDYCDTVHYYDRDLPFMIEGGDVLVLNEEVLAIGISQRTEPDAIELLADRLFSSGSKVKEILAIHTPDTRSYMHLDTICTQVDKGKFLVHPLLLDLAVYRISKDKDPRIMKLDKDLRTILKEALRLDDVTLIRCGGSDLLTAFREQWNDASNTLCIKPGVVICYERNVVTNKILQEHGIKVLTIPSSELSRGRGGPRCMSMPLIREDV